MASWAWPSWPLGTKHLRVAFGASNGTRPRCLEAGEGKTVPEPTSALWLTVARYITGTARRGVNVPPAVRIALRDVVAAAVIPE